MTVGAEGRRTFAMEVFSKLLATRTQRTLAAELGIDQSSVSSAKVSGRIGLDKLRLAAEMAGYSRAEIEASVCCKLSREEVHSRDERACTVKAIVGKLLIGSTQQQLAERLGVRQSSVSRALAHGRIGDWPWRRALELAGISADAVPDSFATSPIDIGKELAAAKDECARAWAQVAELKERVAKLESAIVAQAISASE